MEDIKGRVETNTNQIDIISADTSGTEEIKTEKDDVQVKIAKFKFKAEIIAALITAVSGVLGVWLGSIFESNKGQVILNQTFYGIVSDTENGDISLEEIKQQYLLLQTTLEENAQQNTELNTQLESESNKLREANEKIAELQVAIDIKEQEIEKLNNEISDMYSVNFSNANLIINGIESDYVGKTVTINNEIFYSLGFMQYIVDNQAVSSDGARLFVGNAQSEEMMPVSLFEEDTYFECGYLTHGYSISGNIETTNSFIDNKGNEYFIGVYRWIPNFDTGDTYIECLVDEYSTFAGTII